MAWTFSISICVYLIAFAALINPTVSTLGSISQPCKTDKECQTISILLSCKNDKCECIDDADVKVDEEHQQCVVQETASCYREGPEFDNKFHYVPCIKYAVCGLISRTCECEDRHYSAGNGSCIPQKQHGESCQLNFNITECDTFRIFNCTAGNTDNDSPNGICGCASGLTYHKELDTCFRPIGSSCSRENYFHNPIFPGRYDSCPLQAECYTGICLCRPGFKYSSDGNCYLDYGQRCESINPCSDIQLACRNGTCQCKYPLHQIYDANARECLSVVPGPCEDGKISCVPNAQCVKGQCRCEERYRQNLSGQCVKPNGYDCELDIECDNTKTTLACINNHCSCPDLMQQFDRESESCLGLVGSRCQLVFVSSGAERNSSCVDGAECKPFGPSEQFGKEGECLCQEHLVINEDGTCSDG